MEGTLETWVDQALEAGFTYADILDVDTLHVNPEVRKMCEANTCGMYGKNWSCPPGCGDLEACAEKLKQYSQGIITQTVAQLEDSFDFEGMKQAGSEHWKNFSVLRKEMAKAFDDVLCLAAGSCTNCKECTYPDEPCRSPEMSASSVEAYGLLVNQLCQDNGLKYNYGTDTLAYTALFLIK